MSLQPKTRLAGGAGVLRFVTSSWARSPNSGQGGSSSYPKGIPKGTAHPPSVHWGIEHQYPKEQRPKVFLTKGCDVGLPCCITAPQKPLSFKGCWNSHITAQGWDQGFAPMVGAGSQHRVHPLWSKGVAKNRVRSTPHILGNCSKRKM